MTSTDQSRLIESATRLFCIGCAVIDGMSQVALFDDSIAAQLDQLQVPLRGSNLRQSLSTTHGVLREYRVLIRRGE
jgi:hypothetical protein